MTQLTLADAARSEAINRVDQHAPTDWKARAELVVEYVARTMREFTADDLWEHIEQPPTPSALGPVMLRASRDGVCAKSGRVVLSRNPKRHRDLTIWTSLIYKDTAA